MPLMKLEPAYPLGKNTLIYSEEWHEIILWEFKGDISFVYGMEMLYHPSILKFWKFLSQALMEKDREFQN